MAKWKVPLFSSRVHAPSGKIEASAEGVFTAASPEDDVFFASMDAQQADDASSFGQVILPQRAAALLGGPVYVHKGVARLGRVLKSLVPLPVTTWSTQYFVDGVNGNDANNGTTWALAVKSIWKATQLGNTAAVPYVVNIAYGTYYRPNGFSNNGSVVTASQPCIYQSVGGQVVCINGDAHTFTNTAGTTYQTTRSNANRVLDMVNLDIDGDPTELTKVSSLASCSATPNSWYTDGTTTYVNRMDGAAATSGNTSIILQTVNGGIYFTTNGNMHLYGVTQYGGNSGCLVLTGNQTGRFYGEDSQFKFPGSSFALDCVTGLDCDLAVMVRCVAAKGTKDGFNYHASNGAGPAPKAIHLDCMGYGNGKDVTSVSNNGATIHDGGLLIDINGRYYRNAGGDFAHANANTMAIAIGTVCSGSTGDVDRGGKAPRGTGFHAINGASIYKACCTGSDLLENGTIQTIYPS